MGLSISSYMSNSYSSYRSMANMYRALSSGRRINSAADDPAGLSVAKRLQTQVISKTVRGQNAQNEQDQIRTQEGALGTITDRLQRIRELSSQASNGIYSRSDVSSIQSEIEGIKSSIGSEMLASLGIENYNVVDGNFNISDIDNAINAVSSSRGTLGAQSNGLDHFMAESSNTAVNLAASQSQIEDLDYARMIGQLRTDQAMYQVRMMLQKNNMNNQRQSHSQLFGMLGVS